MVSSLSDLVLSATTNILDNVHRFRRQVIQTRQETVVLLRARSGNVEDGQWNVVATKGGLVRLALSLCPCAARRTLQQRGHRVLIAVYLSIGKRNCGQRRGGASLVTFSSFVWTSNV